VDRGWSSSARCCIVDASVVAIVAGCCADDHEFIARATPASPPFAPWPDILTPGHSLFPKTVMDDSTPVVVRVNFRVSVNWVGYGKVKLKCAKSHGSAGEVLIFLPQ